MTSASCTNPKPNLDHDTSIHSPHPTHRSLPPKTPTILLFPPLLMYNFRKSPKHLSLLQLALNNFWGFNIAADH